MDYEEKYKNALERANKLYEQGTITGSLGYVFPELKESEDERIRKGLIKAVSRIFEGHKLFDTDVTREEALAWLEKQKLTDEEIIFRPITGTDIRIAAKQALEKIDIGKKVVLAFNGAYIPVNGKTVGDIDSEYDAWLENQGENKNTRKREIHDAYLQGVCDTKHEIEKQGKKLDADDVIAWLVANICDFEYYVKRFKEDFEL